MRKEEARARVMDILDRLDADRREPTPMEIDAVEELLLAALMADLDDEFTTNGSPF